MIPPFDQPDLKQLVDSVRPIRYRIVILRTDDKRDVGFRMQPLEECILTPTATWWDDPVVRNMADGRETYKFTLGEDIRMLLTPNMDHCSKMVRKTSD